MRKWILLIVFLNLTRNDSLSNDEDEFNQLNSCSFKVYYDLKLKAFGLNDNNFDFSQSNFLFCSLQSDNFFLFNFKHQSLAVNKIYQ